MHHVGHPGGGQDVNQDVSPSYLLRVQGVKGPASHSVSICSSVLQLNNHANPLQHVFNYVHNGYCFNVKVTQGVLKDSEAGPMAQVIRPIAVRKSWAFKQLTY